MLRQIDDGKTYNDRQLQEPQPSEVVLSKL